MSTGVRTNSRILTKIQIILPVSLDFGGIGFFIRGGECGALI